MLVNFSNSHYGYTLIGDAQGLQGQTKAQRLGDF
jgi:hypothetical protein